MTFKNQPAHFEKKNLHTKFKLLYKKLLFKFNREKENKFKDISNISEKAAERQT